MKSDVEIAQAAKMKPIEEIASKIGLAPDDLELYGKYKAKVTLDAWQRVKDKPNGKLILCTAINPTPAGEGKTTTSVGLADALSRRGRKAAAALLMLLLFGLNPLAMDISMANETMDEMLAMYRSLGMDEAQLEETRAASTEVLELFVLMLPALFLGSSVIEVTACFALLRKVLQRLGIPTQGLPAFTEWHLPVFFPYLFAFSLIGIYWGTTRDISWLYQAGLNGYLIAFIAGLVQGLSLIQFMMQRFHVSFVVRVLIYVFIALNGFMTQIVSWTGLFDIAFDYRKKFRERR